MENALIYEFIGTALMILMGGGVVANSNLNKTKSMGAGWVNIAFGWGFGVFIGVIVAGPHSGAHLNPAVTLAFAVTGLFPWTSVLGYALAQISGAFLGASVVYFFFKNHFDATEDSELKLAIFSTMPAIKNLFHNMLAEVIGTFVLIFVILNIAGPTLETGQGIDMKIGLGSIGALPVAFLVVGIGMSLGGVTGYAINPARDLGPRIAHFLLPIKGKRDSGWSYAPVPVIGPVIGAVLASWAFLLLP
ncbi:MAG: MIP/aquaporin family protein [Flavobacteriaceae bacterium]|nr:MIP/aquaporin family protein [Flavobacteriaceae bacterium]